MLSLEQVYLESLQVLSEVDDYNDDDDDDDSQKHNNNDSTSSLLVVTPLTTTRMRGGETIMISSEKKKKFTIVDDTFYRNHYETNQQIQMIEDDDYYYNPLQLPEYKAYICVRYIRKRKYRMILILMMICFLAYGGFQLYEWFCTSTMSQTWTQKQSKNTTWNETDTN